MVPVQDFFNFSTFIVPSVSSALILQWHSRGTKSETWQNHRLCPKYPKLKLQLLQVHMISVFMPFSQVQQCFNVTVKTDDHESPQLLKQKYGLYLLKLQAKRSSTLPLLGSCICFDTPLGSQFTFATHTTKSSSHQNISLSQGENVVKQTLPKTNQQLQECGNSNLSRRFSKEVTTHP